MAMDFSKYNFLKRLDARARVFVLFGGIIGVIILIYVATQFFSGEGATVGPSRVADAPSGLQSVPGGELTPEYYRALQEANAQAAKQAELTGASAVPTLIRADTSAQMPTSDCTVVCPDQTANVKTSLDEWVKRGAVTPEVSKQLTDLAEQNVIASEYAAKLDELVKAGKLTPEQARELLAKYEKQHADKLLQESGKLMDDMIKTGQLPLDAANVLLNAQKNKATVSEYSAALQDLVRQGKITPQVAQQLLTQYSQQHAKEVVSESIASLQKMQRAGQLTPDVAKELIELERRMVSLSVYNDALQRNIAAGKLTPAVATKIFDEFKAQKASIGPSGTLDRLLQKAEADAYGELDELLKAGKMSQDVADKLRALIQANVSQNDYNNAVNGFVQQGKITPEIAQLKIGDYRAVKGFRDASVALDALQGRNATAAEYANTLKALVQSGAITPAEAAQLMQEYQASINRTPIAVATGSTPGTEGFARLQQQLDQGTPDTGTANASVTQFETAQTESSDQANQAQQDRITALMQAMSGQAGQLVAAWQPPTMMSKVGSATLTKTETTTTATGTGGAAGSSTSATGEAAGGPVIIKAGSILFAVLDTEANSDYPTSPIMATIVAGKYKGARLMGKLVTTKGVSGQMDRISLNFTLMNTNEWDRSKTVTAYGIDPDTARTVMASNVNYHYLQRFGAIMATSFLQGYSTAITNQGTSTTGIFGTSTTHPELSPGNKFMVGLGQVGTALSAVTQNYVNIPPTVKVDSGVGLGILFMQDVT